MLTVRAALNKALHDSMMKNDKVFIIGEEVAEYDGAYKVTEGLLEKFSSKRVIDTPITEAGFAGLAIGSAFSGLKPIVEFMTFNFSMQAIDQIVNSAAKTLYMSGGQIKCPIVFRGPNGSASQVAAQHSQCFASWYSHIPGLTVISPFDSNSSYHLLKKAIEKDSPVVFLEHEILYNYEFEFNENASYEIGKANIMKFGKDITIFSFSMSLVYVLEAANQLSEIIDVEVIDISTLRPLDIETICQSVKKTNKVIIVEEGFPQSGVASEIISVINENVFDYLDHQIVRITGANTPMPYAKHLEKKYLPDTINIIETIKLVYGNCNKNAFSVSNNDRR